MAAIDKQLGACAAVLFVTGADLIATVIATLQLGGDSIWWLRALGAVAFLFFASHLYAHGPRLSRAAASMIAIYTAARLFLLLQLFSVGQLVGFILPTAIHLATFVALLRLPREISLDSNRA